MRSRILSLVLLVTALVSLVADAAPRRRAVRFPSDACSYLLSASLPDPIPEEGLTRSRVGVTIATAGNCAGWAAYADVSWVHVERDGDAAALLTIEPNPTGAPRQAKVTVAGTVLQLTQIGTSIISPPIANNMLQNGFFDVDISHWGWQDRFPNDPGFAVWTGLDANGSMSSGSIRLRDTFATGPAFQQLQCVDAATVGAYDYGFAVRAENRDDVRGIIAFLQFTGPNCSGTYEPYTARTIRVGQAGAWERYEYVGNVTDGHESIMIVIGSWARNGAVNQDVWLDDVFVRRR